MAENSSITVKNGGNLYAWGFISGSGSILAESGATVYAATLCCNNAIRLLHGETVRKDFF